MPTEAGQILREAADIVDGARNTSHGDKERSFIAIAAVWTTYLANRKAGVQSPIRAQDVCRMMAMLKHMRAEWGEPSRDHFLDAAGYCAIDGELTMALEQRARGGLWESDDPSSPPTPFYYLATPYRKYPEGLDAAWKMALEATEMLVEARVPVFCPILSTHYLGHLGGKLSAEEDLSLWMVQDRPLLLASSGLIILTAESWEESVGIAEERRLTAEAGIPEVFWGGDPREIPLLVRMLRLAT